MNEYNTKIFNDRKEWFKNMTLHREHGPAVEYANGDFEWYFNGKLHREDGPAVSRKIHEKEWWVEWWFNGEQHRIGGPAVENVRGKFWYENGNRHRVDGPAIEFVNGDVEWYLNNKRHREDGPAIVRKDGTKAWFLNGIEHTEEEFNLQTNQKSNRNTRPTESDLKQMIEKTIAGFDFEGVQRCIHILAPKFGTTPSIEEMQISVRRIFDDCFTLVMEYGMPIAKIARDGYEATIDVTKDEDNLCRLIFVPVESEVWHCDIEQEKESVNPALEKIDEFEKTILNMIRDLRKEIIES